MSMYCGNHENPLVGYGRMCFCSFVSTKPHWSCSFSSRSIAKCLGSSTKELWKMELSPCPHRNQPLAWLSSDKSFRNLQKYMAVDPHQRFPWVISHPRCHYLPLLRGYLTHQKPPSWSVWCSWMMLDVWCAVAIELSEPTRSGAFWRERAHIFVARRRKVWAEVPTWQLTVTSLESFETTNKNRW